MAKAREPKPPKPPTKKLRKEFFKAFTADNVDEIAKYLDGGLDPNTMFQLDSDEPALAWALDRKRFPKIARLLLDRGVDVKLASPRGVTALHQVEDAGIAAELVERGADVNARDSHDRTPLHTAAAGKQQGVVEVLIARGAELEAADKDGRTPYASASHVGIRAKLRAAGAKSFGPGGGRALAVTVLEDQPRSAIAVDRGALGCDREGNTWFWGYAGGLTKWDGAKVTAYKIEESLAINAIVPGPAGVVYFGSNWGLLRWANHELRLYSSEDSELFDHHLTFTTTSPDGRVYMLSYESEAEDKHISMFDGETFSVLVPGTDFPAGIELQRIVFDARGELMLCGRGGYAVKREGAWAVTEKIDPGTMFTSVVYDLVDDGEALWIGTQSGVFEKRGDAVSKHDMKNLAKYLLKDRDTLWVGTYFGGLARIRGGEISIFDARNSPLPHDDVEGLAHSPDGTMWVQTAGGVACLRDGELQRFE